jgi:hypothetical protein
MNVSIRPWGRKEIGWVTMSTGEKVCNQWSEVGKAQRG